MSLPASNTDKTDEGDPAICWMDGRYGWFCDAMQILAFVVGSFVLALILRTDAIASDKGNSGVRLAEICAAWEARQQSVTAAIFTFQATQVLSNDPKLYPPIPGRRAAVDDERFESLTSSYKTRVSFKGIDGHFRMETNRPKLNLDTGIMAPSEDIATRNREDCRLLEKRHTPVCQKGTMYAPDRGFYSLGDLELRPLVFCCRILAPEMGGYHRRRLAMREAPLPHGIIDGRPCALVSVPSERVGGPLRELWVDPARGCVIRRYVIKRHDGRTSRQVDIEYGRDGEYSWLPTGWTQSILASDGTLRRSMTAKVTSFEINPDLGESEFRIDFNPGTVVVDLRDEEKRAVWLVQPNGKRQSLSSEEMARIWQGGPSTVSRSRSGRLVVYCVGGFVWLSVMAYVIARKGWLPRRSS